MTVSHHSLLAKTHILAAALFIILSTGCLAHHKGALPDEPQNQGGYAQLEDARVHYIDVGPKDAPLVVLVHGFASSLNAWAGVTPVLVKQGYRVVAMDLKGFGWTDRPRGDYSPGAQADLIINLLAELGLEQRPFGLVAHSWGSSVALALTLQNPDRVQRVALYDAWVYEEQLPTFFLWSRASTLGELLIALFYKEQPELKMRNAFYDPSYITEELLVEVQHQLDRPGTRAAALAAIRGQDYALVQEQYATITQPTLLLWGREDAVTPVWVGERLFSELPRAELVVYPNCGHFPMIEAYAASTTKLVSFLEPLQESSDEVQPASGAEKPPAQKPAYEHSDVEVKAAETTEVTTDAEITTKEEVQP